MIELIGPAFTIAMPGAIESLLSAVVADGMAGTRHDSNQELIGQGIANPAAPLFGGFAATLVLVLALAAPLAAGIPLAVLAASLFVVAWNMSEARHFARMVRRAPPADVVILLVTFFLTVFADRVVAVNIGVILAILQFLRRMAGSVQVSPPTRPEQSRPPFARSRKRRAPWGLELHVTFVPAMTREDRRSLAFHRAIAARLADDPKPALNRARHQLRLLALHHQHAAPLLRRWRGWMGLPVAELIERILYPAGT